MKQEFTFDTYEQFMVKWKEITKSNIPKEQITLFAPHPVHGFDDLINSGPSQLRFFTLLGALSGLISGFALTIFTVLSWPIVTAGKPIISLPPFIIIAYELTILFGGVISFIGFLILARMPSYKHLVNQTDYGNKYVIIIESKGETMKNSKLLGLFILVGGVIALIDSVLAIGQQNASLILTLVFWTAITEGCIALVAAVEIAGSSWIEPIKRPLLSVYPLLLFLAVLFVFLYPKLGFYPWVHLNGKWLNKNFFMIRNIALLLVVFFIARKYAIESLKESDKKTTYSVIYLFAFVTSQSFVAFDWVMSLEYPWVSTLFGGYYFIESFYIGVATAGILLYFISQKNPGQFHVYNKVLKDVATLMFGWSIVWVGLMFAQFLTIWYGHLPEESSFFLMRLDIPYYKQLMFLVIALLFVIPFFVLIFKRIKTNPLAIFILSLVIFSGYILERLVILIPLVHINFFLIVIEFFGIAFLFIYLLLPDPQTK